jgi:phosphate transport system substrate-binding protein
MMLTTSSDGVPVLEPKNLVRRRFIMALGAAVIVGAIALLMAGPGASDRIVGSGSTFAQPLIERLSVDFQNARSGDQDWIAGSTGIDYEPVGSLGGIMRLRDVEVDFAVADYPLSPEVLQRDQLVQFPIVIGGIAPIYRLRGVGEAPLQFSAATLVGIFSGKITTWSDPAIAGENPGVTLPSLPITVFHRSDGSGTTLNWSIYLANGSAEWQSSLGTGTTLKWPTGRGVKGSSEMAAAVKAQDGSIGYLEAGQARRAGLQIGAVRNAAGQFVAPTSESIEAGAQAGGLMTGAAVAKVGVESGPASDPAAAEAYPIVTASYAIVKRANRSESDLARTLRFLDFLLEQGADAARSLDYLPLPAGAVAEVKQLWRRELNIDQSNS